MRDLNLLLYQEFLEKVQVFYSENFKLNSDYTGNFENDRIKDSFGRALKLHLEVETNVKNPLNHRTLLNILNAGMAANPRTSTLDILSKFIGYSDYESFIENHGERKSSRSKIVYSILFLFLVTGLAYVFGSKNSDKKYYQLIEKANAAQFEAFKALPEVETENLLRYYTKEGSAFKVIDNIIKRSAQIMRVINLPQDNPSYYSIHKMKVISKSSNKVLVETSEHWYLRWFSLENQEYVKKYDVTNSQVYILIKEGGVWKIDDNDYMGTAQKIESNIAK